MICDDCPHRRDIPGDAHSLCAHPKAPIIFLASLAGGDIATAVEFDPAGAAWTAWPFNFDPVWLRRCRLKPEGGDSE